MDDLISKICKLANIDDIGYLSDGFHTFNGLYEQRMILFAALVKAYKGKAWKSYRHEDGEYCFGGGWFIVGIDTPEGSYTYHYENNYWDMFHCMDLPRGKHWDGHTEADAETRLMSLQPEPCEDAVSRTEVMRMLYEPVHHGFSTLLCEAAIDGVKTLPSVTPKQRTGKWIKTYRNGFGNLIGQCNKCGRSASVDNYCPNCGAKMEGEKDG